MDFERRTTRIRIVRIELHTQHVLESWHHSPYRYRLVVKLHAARLWDSDLSFDRPKVVKSENN